MIISVIIPCYNEEITIGKQIDELKSYFSAKQIVVCDNNSLDKTSEIAKKKGVIVLSEKKIGKGNAVRKLLNNVASDIFILIDGDLTYETKNILNNINLLIKNDYDLIIGKRTNYSKDSFPFGHLLGNKIFNFVIRIFYGDKVTDVLSGYRIFNKKLAKSWPIKSEGFETEVEMTIHAMMMNYSIVEVPVSYKKRPENSISKLLTMRDGLKIMFKIFSLTISHKPLLIFSLISIIKILISLILLFPIFLNFTQTGLIEKGPALFVSITLGILCVISFIVGIILEYTAYFKKDLRPRINKYR